VQRYAVGQILKVFVLNRDSVPRHAEEHGLSWLPPKETPITYCPGEPRLLPNRVGVKKWADGVTVHLKRESIVEFGVDHVLVSTMLKAATAD
jgi:hypothetical protein